MKRTKYQKIVNFKYTYYVDKNSRDLSIYNSSTFNSTGMLILYSYNRILLCHNFPKGTLVLLTREKFEKSFHRSICSKIQKSNFLKRFENKIIQEIDLNNESI